MDDIVTQYGVWFAFGYPIFKEIILPLARKLIPAKVKSEIKQEQKAQEHQFAVEQKRLDMEKQRLEAELQANKQIADNIGKSTQAITAHTEVLRIVLDEVKATRQDTREILSRLPKPRKAAK